MSVRDRATGWAAEGTLLGVLALLYFVDLFLPWSQVCAGLVTPGGGGRGGFPLPGGAFGQGAGHTTALVTAQFCGSQAGGWGSLGTVAGVLAGLLVLWEAGRVARLGSEVGLGYRSLVSAMLGLGVLLFAALNVAARLSWAPQPLGSGLVYGGTFLWVSLALAIAIGLLGWLNWGLWLSNPPGQTAGAPPSVPPPTAPGTCGNCGYVNGAEARYCSMCGSELAVVGGRRRAPRRTSATA